MVYGSKDLSLYPDTVLYFQHVVKHHKYTVLAVACTCNLLILYIIFYGFKKRFFQNIASILFSVLHVLAT